MVKGNRNLTEGNIKGQLIGMTWPMLLGMLGMIIFNLVDTFYVGRLGVDELAAMSFSFPVIMIIGGLAGGIGIGSSSLISRNIIHTARPEVKMMSNRAVLLGLIIVVLFVLIGILTIRPLFSALGAEGTVLNFTYDYMFIWYLGVPFVVIPRIGNDILRATGDTFTPGMIMLIIAVLNAILDPLFIFGIGPFPELGIKGAALATAISRGIGLVPTLYILVKREKLLSIKFGYIKNILSTWKNILYIAVPASLTMLITPISVGFLTKILSGFGKEAVAAFGVASRIEMFALMVIMALGSVLIVFVGQNFSKHKFDRIKSGLNYSLRFSMIWGVFIFIILLVSGNAIASVFSADSTVIKITKMYFFIIGASYGFQGLVALSTSSFNGLNKPYPSAIFSVIRMLVLYIPVAWVGSKLFGINGVFWAGFIANVLIGIFSYKYLFGTVKKLRFDIQPVP